MTVRMTEVKMLWSLKTEKFVIKDGRLWHF